MKVDQAVAARGEMSKAVCSRRGKIRSNRSNRSDIATHLLPETARRTLRSPSARPPLYGGRDAFVFLGAMMILEPGDELDRRDDVAKTDGHSSTPTGFSILANEVLRSSIGH